MRSFSDAFWAGTMTGCGVGYSFCVARMPVSAGVVAGALAALVTWAVCGIDLWLAAPTRPRRPGLPGRPAVQVRALTAGQRCPYCHDDIDGSGVARGACVACGVTYHVGCLLELGRCATLGCAYATRKRQAVHA